MTSTDSVELRGGISTRLPWKTVAKGSRSATRRNRRPAAQSTVMPEVGAEDNKPAAEVEAEGVSESEQLGVAVLGQHFAERVEHVPIKKRRFIVRSPSTSPSPSNGPFSPCREGSDRCAQINHAYVSRLNPNLIDGRTSGVACCDSHDFSGIEILADVACSSGMDDDFAPARDNLSIEEPEQSQNPYTLSIPVESSEPSGGTTAVSQKDFVPESSGKVGQGKVDSAASQENSSDEHSKKHTGVASEKTPAQNNSSAVSLSSWEKPKGNEAAGEAESLVPQRNIATASEKSSTNEHAEKAEKIPCPRDDRLHWDLNLSMDAWAQPCDVEDDPSQRYAEREVTGSGAPAENEPIDSGNDHVDGVITSEGNGNVSTPSDLNPKMNVQNSKEFQSGYDSQFEDGELRESYACWEENEGDTGEIEQVDYGSEPEDERFYSWGGSDENKMEDGDKGTVPEMKSRPRSVSGDAPRTMETNEGSDIEKHVVVCMNDSRVKGGSSPSRGFISKPFKELPSRDAIQRRRTNNYDESYGRDAGAERFVGRDRSGMRMHSRSPGRGHFGGWDSKHRPSPICRGGSHNFGRPRPKKAVEGRGFMNGFDQAGSGPDGHVRRQFPNGACRGRFRRYGDGMNHEFRGGERAFHGDANEYPGRMHHRMGSRRDRSNSPVFRRLHYPHQYRTSRSRSRSRSPVSWNNQHRSPGFRAEERMERVRFPFQKRFPVDQEMGFMSPPRNRLSPQRNSRWFEGRNHDGGDNHNFRGRRSPGRMFRPGPGQRFDNGHSVRRLSSDNHFRPMMRHRRYDGTGNNNIAGSGGGGGGGSGGGSRGCKYEGGDEVKSGNRYETVHRSRRSDANSDGDNIGRLRTNGEESVVVKNNES